MKVINHVIAQNSKVCVYQACTNLNCDFEAFKWQHLEPQFSLWKTMEIFWFGLKPSLHLPGHWVQRKKKPNTEHIFEAQVHFLLLQSWNWIIWFCPGDLACSMTGDWRSWKMLFRLISNMWLWLSRKSYQKLKDGCKGAFPSQHFS